ncbi:MAG: glycosyltransferase, partial [Verrucomicrobium sp.]
MPDKHCIIIPFPLARSAGAAESRVATHCLRLAHWLQSTGQVVTVLQATDGEDLNLADETTRLPLPASVSPPVVWPPCSQTIVSQRVADFLAQHTFDYVHFQDWLGNGFVPLQLRRTLGLPGDPIATVTVHGGTERALESAGRFGDGSLAHLLAEYGERYSVLHADIAILPAEVTETWISQHDWKLPARKVSLPLLEESSTADTEKLWAEWLASVVRERRSSFTSVRSPSQTDARVTVCIAHYNHGAYLPECLASLAAQTTQEFDLVIVDDGSPDEASSRVFDEMQTAYSPRGWQFVRQKNGGASRARNHATEHVKTDYILFVDSDNVAKPDMVETLLTAAKRSGLDVVTCYFHVFEDGTEPLEENIVSECHPAGACEEAGMLTNVFGDTNFIIRTEVFRAMGGFRYDLSCSFEDWEFLAELVLSGRTLDVLPRSLFYYRHLVNSFSRRESARE